MDYDSTALPAELLRPKSPQAIGSPAHPVKPAAAPRASAGHRLDIGIKPAAGHARRVIKATPVSGLRTTPVYVGGGVALTTARRSLNCYPPPETRIRRDDARPSRAIISLQSTTSLRSPTPWGDRLSGSHNYSSSTCIRSQYKTNLRQDIALCMRPLTGRLRI
jgi:hypothetical protein